jgi:hypothetical protein
VSQNQIKPKRTPGNKVAGLTNARKPNTATDRTMNFFTLEIVQLKTIYTVEKRILSATCTTIQNHTQQKWPMN